MSKKSDYTLFEYNLNGEVSVSAIHYLDIAKFLKDYPDAIVFKR